jgi:hypothetical protein
MENPLSTVREADSAATAGAARMRVKADGSAGGRGRRICLLPVE